MYDILDWYWLADDGRLYSSKRQIITNVDDAGYISWQTDFPYQGHWRQTWPREDDGDQTTATLQQVVEVYGLVVSES